MPTFTQFVEAKRDGITFSAAGPVASRRGTIVASSGHDAAAVAASNGIRFGGAYVNEQGSIPDDGLRCTELRIDPTPGAATGGEGLYSWQATYGYPSRSAGFAYPTPPAAPDGKAKARIDYSTVQRPVDRDVAGNPIVNLSGEPFDPAPTIPVVEQRLILTWIRTFYTFQAAHTYRIPYAGKINSAAFFGALPHELFCEGITMQEASLPASATPGTAYMFEGAWLYLQNFLLPTGVTNIGPHWEPGQTLASRRVAGWSYTVNNVGRRVVRYTTGGGVFLREIRENDADPNSELIREPVAIRDDGAAPAGQGRLTTWDTGTPDVRSFQLIRSIDFNTLELEIE